MTTNQPSPLDFPAIDGRPVTEGHARVCRERGHATHKVDGVDQGTCPRCGEVTIPAPTTEVPVLWTVGLTGSGEQITDLATATEAVAIIFGRTDLVVEEDGVGGWLVQLPDEQAAELEETGWLALEVGNWELEAELP